MTFSPTAADLCREVFGVQSLAAANLLSVEETLVLTHPARAVKLTGRLADDLAAPCGAKNGAFLSFPAVALANKECGEAVYIAGLIGLLGATIGVTKVARGCGCVKNVTIVDRATGQPRVEQEECGQRLM